MRIVVFMEFFVLLEVRSIGNVILKSFVYYIVDVWRVEISFEVVFKFWVFF